MPHPAVALTITHRVRAFLQSQGAVLRPWTGVEETYAELHRLLNERRDDSVFWGPLRELLADVLTRISTPGATPLPAPQAELLASWDVDQLVRDLRAALPEAADANVNGWIERFAAHASAPVLGGFLLLGWRLSGCGGTTSSSDSGGASGGTTSGDAGTEPPVDAAADAPLNLDAYGPDAGQTEDASQAEDAGSPAWARNCALDRDSVLYRAIADSTLGDWSKEALCGCFSSLGPSWNAGLTELFATATPEEVAAALQEMTECCSSGQLSGVEYQEAYGEQLLDGTLCYLALPYRGVDFPDR